MAHVLRQGSVLEMGELRTQLDERSKKIDALPAQNSRILGHIADHVAESGLRKCWAISMDFSINVLG